MLARSNYGSGTGESQEHDGSIAGAGQVNRRNMMDQLQEQDSLNRRNMMDQLQERDR